MSSGSFAFVRGEIIPRKRLSFTSAIFPSREDTVFLISSRSASEHPYFLNDYLDRFYHSATVMRLVVPYVRRDLKIIIQQLIKQNDLR